MLHVKLKTHVCHRCSLQPPRRPPRAAGAAAPLGAWGGDMDAVARVGAPLSRAEYAAGLGEAL